MSRKSRRKLNPDGTLAPRNKGGRPQAITPDVLQKLEDAFTNSLTDEEACTYAKISSRTLYNYQGRHPDFVQRKEALRLTPNIAARKTIVGQLGDIATAKWWAEHKMDEFRPQTNVRVSGQINHAVVELTPEVMEAARMWEEIREKQIAEASRKLP